LREAPTAFQEDKMDNLAYPHFLFYLLPLEEIDHQVMEFLAAIIKERFRAPAIILPPEDLPKITGKSDGRRRKTYSADILFGHLKKIMPADGRRLIGVTRRSLTSDDYPGDYDGMAIIGGSVALISIRRLRFWLFWPRIFWRRLTVLALHEIGHTFGNRHCRERCPMSAGNFFQELNFCDSCQGRINRYLLMDATLHLINLGKNFEGNGDISKARAALSAAQSRFERLMKITAESYQMTLARLGEEIARLEEKVDAK